MSTRILNFSLVVFLFAAIGVTKAFVRYGVLKNLNSAFEANAACVNNHYSGLAVIDTPTKWDFTLTLINYEQVPTAQKLWIGLTLNVPTGQFQWRGSKVLSWSAWLPGAPGPANAQVAVMYRGGAWGWDTDGGNYEYWILCEKQSPNLKMRQHPNKNIDLAGFTPLMMKTVTSHEDCGMTCSLMSACLYVTSDLSINSSNCKLYDSRVSSNLTSIGPLNSFTLYSVTIE